MVTAPVRDDGSAESGAWKAAAVARTAANTVREKSMALVRAEILRGDHERRRCQRKVAHTRGCPLVAPKESPPLAKTRQRVMTRVTRTATDSGPNRHLACQGRPQSLVCLQLSGQLACAPCLSMLPMLHGSCFLGRRLAGQHSAQGGFKLMAPSCAPSRSARGTMGHREKARGEPMSGGARCSPREETYGSAAVDLAVVDLARSACAGLRSATALRTASSPSAAL